MTNPSSLRHIPLLLLPLCGMSIALPSWAQSTAPTASPADLAKYDRNQNRVLDADEVATMQADRQRDARAAVVKPDAADKNSVVTLSPFEVVAEDTGYMATNSASGTRLNSRLEDIASPISVVTKQQLQDMAMVDLNDIFRTETNVEGLYQYTEIGNDRNNIVDVASNNPEANNRIRGMGQANITVGGMSVSSATPIDSYNVDSIEINRGANSSIFGIGSTSGTVNLNLASANVSTEITKTSFMTDDLGRLRGSFDINRPIIKDVLAIRLMGAYDQLGFVREPAESITKRFTLAARAQPFKKTTLKASYETYRNSASLPNQLTPREAITEWKARGSYTWNPNTFTVHNAAGNPVPGGTYLGTTNGTASNGQLQLFNTYGFRGGPGAFGNGGDSNNVRALMGYIGGEIAYFTQTHSFNWASRNATTQANTYNNTGNQRTADFQLAGVQVYVPEVNPATGQPFGWVNSAFDVFHTGVHGPEGQAFYDWTSVNLNASNFARRQSNVTRFELQQDLFETQRQRMALRLAALYEDVENKSWNFIGGGGDGVQAIIYPDINRVLPDGSPNPGFLRPHVRARQPQIFYRPEKNDTHKAELAYQLDLTRNEGWTKWFGRHNVVGYGEQRVRRFGTLRYRSQPANQDNLLRQTGLNTDSVNTRYYLGDATGFNIDDVTTAPPTSGTFPVTYWSTEFGATGATRVADPQWRTADITLAEVYFNGGTNKNEIKTQGGIWQGFLAEGRVIPILGYRKDTIRFKSSKPFPATYSIGSGVYTDPTQGIFDFQDNYIVTNPRLGLRENQGTTRTKGLVLKPFLGFTKSRFLDGISFTYNESDSFEPANLAIDTYGDIVDNPRGMDESYGVRFSLLDDRLWISVNKYENITINARNGGADVVAGRAIPFDRDSGESDPDNAFGGVGSGTQLDLFDWYFFRIYGSTSLATGTPAGTLPEPFREGTGDPAYAQARGLIGTNNAETLQRVTDHVYTLMQFDKEIVRKITQTPGATRTATNDVTSEGYEAEVLYRSLDGNFNFKLTGSRKQTVDSNLAASLTRYIAERQPVLEAAVWPPADYPFSGPRESFWNSPSSGTPTTRGNQWTGNVLGTYLPLVANLGKPRSQVRRYSLSATGSYNLRDLFENRHLKNIRVGGNIGWASKASIGYGYKVPTPNPVTGEILINEFDNDKRFYDKARYSASAWVAYDFRMLSDRIKSSIQLNVQNMLEEGRLQVTHRRTDGSAWNYRIIDPRVFQLTWNLEL